MCSYVYKLYKTFRHTYGSPQKSDYYFTSQMYTFYLCNFVGYLAIPNWTLECVWQGKKLSAEDKQHLRGVPQGASDRY